ncbi:hypothetical protein ANRL3_02583 [Anaerolineae bacterium]|nr:hypothetical protein ANRL3_02583 [Anaerolineae bacterium]
MANDSKIEGSNKTTDKTTEHINNYYSLNLSHLNYSFWASLLSLIAGLIALLFGVYRLYQGDATAQTNLTIIGGVLTEFIGMGFFILYTKNLGQLNIFYQKLVQHQNVLYSIGIAREFSGQERLELLRAVTGKLLSSGDPPISDDVYKMILTNQKSSQLNTNSDLSTQ